MYGSFLDMMITIILVEVNRRPTEKHMPHICKACSIGTFIHNYEELRIPTSVIAWLSSRYRPQHFLCTVTANLSC